MLLSDKPGFAHSSPAGRGLDCQPTGPISVVADHSKFEGYFIQGEMKGEGTMWFPNGDKYEGTFAKNQMHGHGIYLFASGDRYEGEYDSGKRVTGVIYQNGQSYASEFVNGQVGLPGRTCTHDGGLFMF